MLDKNALFEAVFAPDETDTVLFMVDVPHGTIQDHSDWAERRIMAEEWRAAFTAFPLSVRPLLTYPASGANNGDLPDQGEMEGQPVVLKEVIADSTIIVAMTEYSATAPLARWTKQYPTIRVASMPGVLRRMEETALAADYREVARRTQLLADWLTQANSAQLVFDSGDELTLDLRYRTGHADDGLCHPGKPFPLINLPSGEAFIVPYEGERAETPSQTSGRIPMHLNGELFALDVQANRIVAVNGPGSEARAFDRYLKADPARANVAELGLGCNERAVVKGSVIEDEKAGLHWAYGRSEHLGGTVGPDAFRDPAHVVHQDIVYAPDSAIGVHSLTLQLPDGTQHEVIRENEYTVF